MSEEAVASKAAESTKDNKEVLKEKLSEENQLLLKFQVHLDRALKLMPLQSANGMRRVLVAYMKAGVQDAPVMKKEEQALFNELIQLHDAKYALILRAIDKSAEEVKQEESNKENTDG